MPLETVTNLSTNTTNLSSSVIGAHIEADMQIRYESNSPALRRLETNERPAPAVGMVMDAGPGPHRGVCVCFFVNRGIRQMARRNPWNARHRAGEAFQLVFIVVVVVDRRGCRMSAGSPSCKPVEKEGPSTAAERTRHRTGLLCCLKSTLGCFARICSIRVHHLVGGRPRRRSSAPTAASQSSRAVL